MSIGPLYQNPNGDTQCDAKGLLGDYVIRKTADHTWIAIQLFGAIGSIAATALTPEVAFELAESYYAYRNKMHLKMTLEIEGCETSDLEIALQQAQERVSEGYTSGFDNNDTGNYRFAITALN